MTDITQRIMRLFEKHQHFFIGDISNTFALNSEQMERHKDRLFWSSIEPYHVFGGLSWNRNLNWSKELLDQFKDRWDWGFISISVIGNFIWFDGILDYFDDRLDWAGVSENWEIPWNTQLIHQYTDKLEWKKVSGNQNIPWTEDLIHKYADRIDFRGLSGSLNSPFWRNNYGHIRNTLQTPNVIDNIRLIEQYENRWDWDYLNWNWLKGLSQGEQHDLVETMLRNAPVAPESVEETFDANR